LPSAFLAGSGGEVFGARRRPRNSRSSSRAGSEKPGTADNVGDRRLTHALQTANSSSNARPVSPAQCLEIRSSSDVTVRIVRRFRVVRHCTAMRFVARLLQQT